MRQQTHPTNPSCHCHYHVVTDGATFRSIYGHNAIHALHLFRKLIRSYMDDSVIAQLPNGYLANRRAEFVRCPNCSN